MSRQHTYTSTIIWTGDRGQGPTIRVKRGTDLAGADALHHQVHRFCFIARSVNFPVAYEAKYIEH